jgi:sucrose-6-phosphate hydrolase SacC (GH32 family)
LVPARRAHGRSCAALRDDGVHQQQRVEHVRVRLGERTNFNLVRSNAYPPPYSLIHDPSVIRHTDGYYYVVYTTGWTGNTIGLARSADYTTWTFLRNVTVGLNGSTGSTWAPEWFKDSDGSVHVVFSASTAGMGGQFRPYRITATPALVQLPDGRWRIYFDQYAAKRYYYADSSNLNTFGAKVELSGLSGTAQHFTVPRENVGDSTAVPTGRRSVRSVNFPDRYVRHRNNVAYVEPVGTATDRADATFTDVGGLANRNCYSFESVNFPATTCGTSTLICA